MKKIILSFFAIAALTACSKSHIEYDEPAEIALVPVAENITKAMVTGTAFPEEQFNVWAFYKQVDPGTTIAAWQASSPAQQTYINEKQFATRKDDAAGLWGGFNTTYYWPKAGSLLFAGYYPVTIDNPTETNPDGAVTYEFTSSVNKMTVSGYSPGDYETTGFVNTAAGANHVEDFMYFNMTPTSCATGPVQVKFRHALSWITVKLQKSKITPTDAKIIVNSVKFTDVYKKGTGTVNNSPVAPATNEITWSLEGNTIDIEVCPDDNTATEDVKENSIELSKEPTQLLKNPIIIPQAMGGNLVVNYTIKSTDNSAFTETKTIALRGMVGTVSGEATGKQLTTWQPAKHYTYTITIGTSEILIEPSVENWKDVSVTPSI